MSSTEALGCLIRCRSACTTSTKLWGHVGGHPDGNASGAIDQEVRNRGGQNDRLGLAPVVVGLEVHGVFVDRCSHRDRAVVHPTFGVAHRRRTVVRRAEVAVTVDERQAHRPWLGHPHQRVIDRGVAMGVEATHDLTDDTRALHVTPVRPEVHVIHRVEDSALHWLEPVAGIGEGPAIDHRVGVLKKTGPHLLADIDVDDVFFELLRWCSRLASSHAGHSHRYGQGWPPGHAANDAV